MDQDREKELLEVLGRIASYLEKISAALTAEVALRAKEETHGISEAHESTQVFLRSMEMVREEALQVLRRRFPKSTA